MDKFKAMRVYVEVCRAGGFAGAARRLGISPPSVTRIVNELEGDLGVTLLHRTTRAIHITEIGREFQLQAEQVLQSCDEVFDTARGARVIPRGKVRLTAPVLFGRYYVSPTLNRFMEKYPEVEIDTVYVDRPVQLVDEGFDIGVRIGHLQDSSLLARRVGSVRRVVCASPAYLKRHGIPKHPSELAAAETISARPITPTPQWKFAQGLAVEVQSRRTTSNIADAIAVCRAGGGFTQVFGYQIGSEQVSGELEVVLEDYEVDPIPVQVLHTEGRTTAAKVRLLVDDLTRDLAEALEIIASAGKH
ncbi:LysR family transcriptional regulator [Microbulbifer magnicolonia]|uniref:LysR family transcriptional regulator n=1 Tax=Microbulbifer magnicolonia TaxID=3109744 RepID=UPI002B40455A|nr:LysR family transcriptional regulator [Microbulbifer sp. GG15]